MLVDNDRNIVIRQMTVDDLEQVMIWRMDPDITRYMNTDPMLTIEGQVKWFNERKIRDDNYMFIIEEDNKPIGVLTIDELDRKNNRCTSGLYIGERSRRSLGLAVRLVCSLQEFIFETLRLNRNTAQIFSENKGLIRINKMCGWEIEGILHQHIFKYGQYHDITLMAMNKEHWEEVKGKIAYKMISFVID